MTPGSGQRAGIGIAIAAGVALTAVSSAGAYRTGAPAGHTGGFGEPTCAACHFPGEDLSGSVSVVAPDAYRPGERYEIRVVLEDPEMRSGGFQLSARFGEGDRRGGQAGSFSASGDSGIEVLSDTAGVQYVGHSAAGVRPVGRDEKGRVAWSVQWTAPDRHPVTFHAAANAANDDDSEFGDRIYVAERRIEQRNAGARPD